jgi:cation diffusion facilitator CzcD-associated flavoprotein CzcO
VETLPARAATKLVALSAVARGERTRRIGIVGAGAGGIAAAVKLRAAGFDDFVILEQADGVGGTWWHNRYPGLSCDIKSHLYAFSFAPKLDWVRPYGSRDEILSYLEQVVDDQGLRDRIRLGTRVAAAAWDDTGAEWTLTTASGEILTFDVVVASLGMFNELNMPEIAGIDSFAGSMFHSARWPSDVDLDGARVGVIGSAASAVQLVPEVAKAADRLFVFQRSANWVLPKEDTPWTAEQLEQFHTDPGTVARLRKEIFDQVDGAITFSNPEALRLATELGRRAIDVVEDPELRQKLTPDAPYGCQRPLVSNDYYPTFNRDNVELVTEPIERITAHGVATCDGVVRKVDALVLATGFKTTSYLAAIDVTGRSGLHIADHWSHGAHAYLGLTTAGFPNLFMLYGPNTNNGSIIYMLECQADYVLRVLQWMEAKDLAWVDVRPEVEARYNDELQRALDSIGVWAAGGCHNYYRGASGRIETQWPHSMSEYRRRTEAPDPDDFATSDD